MSASHCVHSVIYSDAGGSAGCTEFTGATEAGAEAEPGLIAETVGCCTSRCAARPSKDCTFSGVFGVQWNIFALFSQFHSCRGEQRRLIILSRCVALRFDSCQHSLSPHSCWASCSHFRTSVSMTAYIGLKPAKQRMRPRDGEQHISLAMVADVGHVGAVIQLLRTFSIQSHCTHGMEKPPACSVMRALPRTHKLKPGKQSTPVCPAKVCIHGPHGGAIARSLRCG